MSGLDLPAGRFGTIVADPPWLLRVGGAGPGKGAISQYGLMPLGEVMALRLEPLVAADCVMFLWVPSLNLIHGDAYMALAAWRFVPKSLHTWVKPGLGVGWFGRSNTEHFVVATRGAPAVRFSAIGTWHHWQRRRHSEKPEDFYRLVEAVSHERPLLDLFARRHRPGWVAWGEEL